jgi:Fe-S-cluster containining protein
MRIEFGHQRTFCDCENCQLNCRTMPGYLIPADLRRMLPEEGEVFAWAEQNLLASPGALVEKNGNRFRIPTLVPAVKADGSCINYTAEGRCAIHQIAPFGCAFFDCKSPPLSSRDNLSKAGLTAVYKEMFQKSETLYRRIWSHLAEKGLVAQSADVLREKMRKELQK